MVKMGNLFSRRASPPAKRAIAPIATIRYSARQHDSLDGVSQARYTGLA